MTQYARPDADSSNPGGWAQSTGITLYGVIDEDDDSDNSDYVSVNDMIGSMLSFEVELAPVTDPESDLLHEFSIRAKAAIAPNDITVTILLKQGASTIASKTVTTLTTSVATFTHSLSEAEAAAITDYSDLRLHITHQDAGMSMTDTEVHQAYFECGNVPTSDDKPPQTFNLVPGGELGTSFSLDIDESMFSLMGL